MTTATSEVQLTPEQRECALAVAIALTIIYAGPRDWRWWVLRACFARGTDEFTHDLLWSLRDWDTAEWTDAEAWLQYVASCTQD